ncbi:MAG: hypothetical protein ACRD1T_09655 [Acidimicrobiia bacterium]
MIKPADTRNAYLRPIYVAALAIFGIVGCSGDSGGSGFAEAQKTYEQEATERADTLAGLMADAYVEQISSGVSGLDTVAEQFEGQVSGLNEFLCDRVEVLAKDAGSGDTKASRLDDVRVATEEIVQDAVAGALLDKALSAPAEQRDQILDGLGVESAAPDGTALRGTAALQDVGLLDGQGRLTIPKRKTDEHIRYERWAFGEARSFGGTVGKLIAGTRTTIEQCISSA